MARSAEGWRVRPKRGVYQVRFRHQGRRFEVSTRTGDLGEAKRLAPTIYSDIVTGRVRRSASGALIHPATPIEELIADWIDAITPELGRDTDKTYEVYGRHWRQHFETIGSVTTASIGDYQRKRLAKVVRGTVVKERSALRRFLSWLVERESLAEVPPFPPLAKKATGTTATGRRRAPEPIQPEELSAIIAALPEWSERTQQGKRFPIRARFEFAYETALRPTFLDVVCWDDVTPFGLRIRPELDKNRWGRTVPLSPAARAALERIGAPRPGEPIFGSHDYRTQVRAAAIAVLGDERGKRVTPYDVKHTRVTGWLDDGASVLGVRYLTGTKLALDKYAHPSRRAAERVLAGSFGGHSGDGAIGKECEGEDLNLHGSYPASTSS